MCACAYKRGKPHTDSEIPPPEGNVAFDDNFDDDPAKESGIIKQFVLNTVTSVPTYTLKINPDWTCLLRQVGCMRWGRYLVMLGLFDQT